MKKIVFVIVCIVFISQSFAQKENSLFKFYNEFYQFSAQLSEEDLFKDFTSKYESNSFDDDFKMAIYSVLINNRISTSSSESFKAFLLIQIMNKDDKDKPLYQQIGSELNALYKILKDQALLDHVKMQINDGRTEIKDGNISIELSEWTKAKEYLGKYRIVKEYSNN